MIIDNLNNASLYYGLGDRVAQGLKYLQNTDFSQVECGKYQIDGENLYAIISNYETKILEEGKWEGHQKYIDIQYIFDGAEKMGYANITKMSSNEPYNQEKDIEFFQGEGDLMTVSKGEFAIFSPEDIHMPGIYAEPFKTVKKVVVKVLI